MSIPKMCLKQSFSYSNRVLQAILYLTVISNFDALLTDCTKFCSFFRLLNRKFNEDFKNLKIAQYQIKMFFQSFVFFRISPEVMAILQMLKRHIIELKIAQLYSNLTDSVFFTVAEIPE